MLPAGFVKGVNQAHVHRGGRGYGSDIAREQLQTLRGIGFDWVALTPFGYQSTAHANTIRMGDRSMTDDNLLHEIRHAHQAGLRVLIKPHIWSRDFWTGDQWHGSIRQNNDADQAQWWSAYRALILHYAKIAQAGRADAFCLGTELVLMTRGQAQRWQDLIREVRAIYQGYLTYAAHWDQEWRDIKFWEDLDAVGISMYFPIDAPDDADVDQLVRAWKPWREKLDAFAQTLDQPIVFLEVGYRPALGSFRKPWEYEGGQYDEPTQARAFDAMFQALHDAPWWRGVFVWKSFTDPDHTERHTDRADFSFQNRAGEQVLARWFGMPATELK